MDLAAARDRLTRSFERWRLNRKNIVELNGASLFSYLGEKVGRSDEMVRQWIRGKSFPPLTILDALCQAIDTDPLYILFGQAIQDERTSTDVSEEESKLLNDFRKLTSADQQKIISTTSDLARQTEAFLADPRIAELIRNTKL